MFKLYHTTKGMFIEHEGEFFFQGEVDWDIFINQDNLYQVLKKNWKGGLLDSSFLNGVLLPPMGNQEIWASGVTYLRSREARMEESKEGGGRDFYAKVYDADRPELFFKATRYRTVGHGDQVKIRKDSKWNVPEPELTLFMTSSGKIVGYTIGNDMSSRDIEGENPLYLPQAKSYDGSAALGPALCVLEQPLSLDTEIKLIIKRLDKSVFEGSITLQQMKRTFKDLVHYLFRACSFPLGVFLMTGTGIIPPNEFTLASGDEIEIQIEGLGTLKNQVA